MSLANVVDMTAVQVMNEISRLEAINGGKPGKKRPRYRRRGCNRAKRNGTYKKKNWKKGKIYIKKKLVSFFFCVLRINTYTTPYFLNLIDSWKLG